jgi:16S rRNA (cytosine967-C5)-methyltransferase
LKNVWPLLKPGGQLIYITCSVFEEENESAIEFIKQLPNSTIEKFELIEGVKDKADTMFVGRVLKGK